MFGKKLMNGYFPPTDREELEKEHQLILEKKSKLSYSERAKVLTAYVTMKMYDRAKQEREKKNPTENIKIETKPPKK